MPVDQEKIISITTGTIIRIGVVVLLAFLAYFLRDLILVLLTSVVVASSVEPLAQALMRWRLPRVLSVLAVYLIVLIILSVMIYLFVPLLFVELSNLAATLPDRFSSFDLFDPALDPLAAITGGLAKSISLKDLIVQIQEGIVAQSGGLFSATGSVFGGALSFIMIVVISFYLAVQEDGVGEFLRLVTPVAHEKYVIGLWQRSREKIGQWAKGQLLLGLIIGVLVYLGLSVLQVKYALLLAILAAIMELIPFFGPVLSAVPAVLLGFSDSFVLGLLVLGFYIIIQQFENHLIYPLVVRKIVGIPPIIVIIVLFVGARLAGFLGLLLAVPVATLLLEIAADYQKKKHIFREANG
ncbi:MAG: AI-2E family transporter [bacterium]|nr:AI-2E family transporter [bacterium]